MRRSFPVVPLVFAATAAAAAALAPACGDECSRARDCESGEVCYKGVCTPISAEYVSCQTAADCDPQGGFLCRSGRCSLQQSTSTPVDGGTRDGGPTDASTAPDAGGSGTPDSGMGGGGGDAGVGQFQATRRAMQVTFTSADIHLIASTNTLFIQGTSARGETVEINIVNPTSNTTYPCSGAQTTINYRFSANEEYRAGNANTCSVFLELFGGVGSTVRGTFEGELAQTVGGAGTLSVTAGVFSAQRRPDQ